MQVPIAAMVGFVDLLDCHCVLQHPVFLFVHNEEKKGLTQFSARKFEDIALELHPR